MLSKLFVLLIVQDFVLSQYCPTSCASCNQYGSCVTCLDSNADTATNCESCLAGYGLFAGTCQPRPCPRGCLACDSSNKCSACLDPNADPTLDCRTCSTGYELAAGLCQEVNCPVKCSECDLLTNKCKSCWDPLADPSTRCEACQGDYKREGLLCQITQGCPSTCLRCDNSRNCVTCLDPNADPGRNCDACYSGFGKIKNLCLLIGAAGGCPPGCATCDPATLVCTSCFDPFADVKEQCLQCQNGFTNVSGVCQQGEQAACPTACAACEGGTVKCTLCKDVNADPNATCTACLSGFASSGQGQPCTPLSCPATCKSCNSSNYCDNCNDANADPGKNCLACKEGFNNDTGVCQQAKPAVACPATCGGCDPNGTCTSCNDTNANATVNCTACKGGFIRISQTCQPEGAAVVCPNGCFSCDNFGVCTNCSDPNSDPAQNCTACKSGFDSISNVCLPPASTCPSTCSACDSNNVCTACANQTDSPAFNCSKTPVDLRVQWTDYVASVLVRFIQPFSNNTDIKSLRAFVYVPQLDQFNFRLLAEENLNIVGATEIDSHTALLMFDYPKNSYDSGGYIGIARPGEPVQYAKETYIPSEATHAYLLGRVKAVVILAAILMGLSLAIYLAGYKHNHIMFFFQLIGFLVFGIAASPQLIKMLFSLRIIWYKFKDSLSLLPNTYVENSRGRFAELAIDANYARHAVIPMIFVWASVAIGILGLIYYTAKDQLKQRSSFRTLGYRLLEFFMKTSMFPIIFFSIASLTFNNELGGVATSSRATEVLSDVFAGVWIGFFFLLTTGMLFCKSIGPYTRAENVGEFVFDVIASVVIIRTLGSKSVLALLAVIVARGVGELVLRKVAGQLTRAEMIKAVAIAGECAVLLILGLGTEHSKMVLPVSIVLLVTAAVDVVYSVIYLGLKMKKNEKAAKNDRKPNVVTEEHLSVKH